MISDFGALITAVVEVFQIEFTIYGYTFSMWEVFLFDVVAGIVAWAIGKLLLDH